MKLRYRYIINYDTGLMLLESRPDDAVTEAVSCIPTKTIVELYQQYLKHPASKTTEWVHVCKYLTYRLAVARLGFMYEAPGIDITSVQTFDDYARVVVEIYDALRVNDQPLTNLLCTLAQSLPLRTAHIEAFIDLYERCFNHEDYQCFTTAAQIGVYLESEQREACENQQLLYARAISEIKETIAPFLPEHAQYSSEELLLKLVERIIKNSDDVIDSKEFNMAHEGLKARGSL